MRLEIYFSGVDVQRNINKGIYYFIQSASLGDKVSENNLGIFNYIGEYI